jgi:glycosyltransferase involved in cell wall biosynthesis
MKVLVAFKSPKADNPQACHVGLGVTATNIVMSLREMRIEADARAVSNGEYLWAMIAAGTYTHVVLCAPFIDAAFLAKLFAAFPRISFSLVYHSNLGFLSQDRFAVASLAQYVELQKKARNFVVGSNSSELALAVPDATGDDFTYLPNLFHLPHHIRRTRPQWKLGMVLNVGLFGAARVLKNWLTATVATMIMSRVIRDTVNLHVSTSRDEGSEHTRANMADLVAMNPSVRLIDVPWMDNDDFRRYLYSMDLLLQPSYSETFNNVTAEGAACGVPSVVSDAISWAPASWIARSDSAISVAQTGLALVRSATATEDGWQALSDYNEQAARRWHEWLARAV